MFLQFHRSMWSSQWFIVLLCYGVSYLPTKIRRGSRNSVGVIPLRDSSSGFYSFNFETTRLHHGCVIESVINVCKLRQISQSQIWDPGLARFEIDEDGAKLRPDFTTRSRSLLYLMIMGLYLSTLKRTTISDEVGTLYFPVMTSVNNYIPSNGVAEKETNIQDTTSPFADNISKRTKAFTSYANRSVTETQTSQERQQLCERRHWIFQYPNISSEADDFFFSVLVSVDIAIRMRIRRSNQQYVWIYGTITKTYISIFRRVPKSMVLRCNGWIADLVFRKRKRWYIDKNKMFPKLERYTRLTDKTRATKHMIRIAAPKLFCFFVTTIFDCIYILMVNNVIFGSHQ